MDQEKTGRLIAALRKEAGMTQEELGGKLGVSQRSVSRWETGRNMPDISLLTPLADTLGVDVTELLRGERIEGETVSKSDAADTASALIVLARDKRRLRNGIMALIAGVLTLAAMLGFYNMEFCVSIRSAADLERAIAEYRHLGSGEPSVDVLEWESVGNQLVVLYRTGVRTGGLARMERGLFGKYRILGAGENDGVLCEAKPMKLGRRNYLAVYALDGLPGIASFEVRDEQTGALLYAGKEQSKAFLEMVALEEAPAVYPSGSVHYYDAAGREFTLAELREWFGISNGIGGSGTGTAETGKIYVLEAILLFAGAVIVRYFLKREY